MRYVYSLVRFVPDPARGEFINVGAVVGNEETLEWEVRQLENPTRARALDEHGTLDAAWAFIDSIGRDLDDYSIDLDTLFEPAVRPSSQWLHRLHIDHRNIVQLSPPAPVKAEDMDDAFEKVFEEFIVDPTRRRHRFQKKHAAFGAVSRTYKRLVKPGAASIHHRVVVVTDHHSERVDFALTNARALQLAHTWSFQIPAQDVVAEQVKAWGWTMRELRNTGATVTSGPSGFEVRKDVDLEVVYVPPLPEQDSPALKDALAVFDALDVNHYPLENVAAFATSTEELLANQ